MVGRAVLSTVWFSDARSIESMRPTNSRTMCCFSSGRPGAGTACVVIRSSFGSGVCGTTEEPGRHQAAMVACRNIVSLFLRAGACHALLVCKDLRTLLHHCKIASVHARD